MNTLSRAQMRYVQNYLFGAAEIVTIIKNQQRWIRATSQNNDERDHLKSLLRDVLFAAPETLLGEELLSSISKVLGEQTSEG